MYVPSSFSETDRGVLLELIDEYSFATFYSSTHGAPMVSHIPLLVERGGPGEERILGHVARANKHWELFDGVNEVLAVFQGPHGYISPAWYSTAPSVPTWNYAVAHVHGRPRVVDSDQTRSILSRMIDKYERTRPNRWSGELPADFVAEELRAIVGFEMRIDRIEGKLKLSQNRSLPDREGALAGLQNAPDLASRELAEYTRRHYARGGDQQPYGADGAGRT